MTLSGQDRMEGLTWYIICYSLHGDKTVAKDSVFC